MDSHGFQFVSGKKIEISENARQRAKTIFQDLDYSNEINKELPTESSHNSDSNGFQFVSGKKIEISDKARERAKTIFQDLDYSNEINKELPTESSHNSDSNGFQFVSGKKIEISDKTRERAKTIFQDLDYSNEINKELPTESSHNSDSNGFQFVSGKKIEISDKAKERAKTIFQDLDYSNEINKELPTESSHNSDSNGFQFVSGKKIEISDKAKERAKTIFQDLDYSNEINKELPTESSHNSDSNGFQFVSGKKIEISDKAKERAKTIFQDFDKENNFDYVSEYNSKFVNKSKLIQNVEIFKSPEERVLIEQRSIYHDNKISCTKTFESSCTAFKIGSNLNSKSSSTRQHRTSSTTSTIAPEIRKTNSLSTFTSLKKQEQSTEFQFKFNENKQQQESLEKIKNFTDSSKLSVSNNTKHLSLSLSLKRKRNYDESSTNDSPMSKKHDHENVKVGLNSLKVIKIQNSANTPELKKFFKSTTIHTSTPKQYTNFSEKDNINVFNENDEKDTTHLKDIKQNKVIISKSENNSCHQKLLETTQKTVSKSLDKVLGNDHNMIIVRDSLRAKQIDQIELKLKRPIELCAHLKAKSNKICSGLFCWKKTLSNRKSIAEFIEEELNKNNFKNKEIKSKCILTNSERWQKISTLNISNVMKFQFSLSEFEEKTDSNYCPLIILNENCTTIIPDNYNEIGFNDIKNAFLTIPEVQIQLIPNEWFENHYSMILLKLSALEISYPEIFYDRLLHPNHIINQIKYRYNREIIMKHNSCIKTLLDNYKRNDCTKITDNLKRKCIALVVLKIIKNENDTNMIEMILSDRWYCIKTKIDIEMKKLINEQKIKIGMKLIIQNFDIIQTDDNNIINEDIISNSHILKMFKYSLLKIQTNSVRSITDKMYSIKLGFIRNFEEMLNFRLDSIFENGGIISSLKLLILREYPVMFIRISDKDKKCSEYISKKDMKALIENYCKNAANFENYQYLYNQACTEYEIEEKMQQKINEKQEIYKIFDIIKIDKNEKNFENALRYGHNNLTEFVLENYPDKMNTLQKYQNQQQCFKDEQIQNKVQYRIMQTLGFIKVFKYLVTDIEKPTKKVILSIKNPNQIDEWIKLNKKSYIQVKNLYINGYNDDNLINISNTQYTTLKILNKSNNIDEL